MSGVAEDFGIAVGKAVARGDVSIDELVALRAQLTSSLRATGALGEAQAALDTELSKRGVELKDISISAVDHQFRVDVSGVALTDKVRSRIESEINSAVTKILAETDTGGDQRITPLSEINTFGQKGIGGAGIMGGFVHY